MTACSVPMKKRRNQGRPPLVFGTVYKVEFSSSERASHLLMFFRVESDRKIGQKIARMCNTTPTRFSIGMDVYLLLEGRCANC